MKKALLLLSACMIFISFAWAQPPNPVHWTWKAESLGKGEYKLIFTAAIDKHWHTYGMYIADGGPVPTAVKFDETNKDFTKTGKATEAGGKIHDAHDPVFDMQLKYFEDAMIIVQNVKVTKDTKLKGSIESMACDDKSCLPPSDANFEFDLKAK